MLGKAKRSQSDVNLEQRVRRDLDFLFLEYGATVTANTVEPFGISELTVETDSLELKFTNNKRDADYRILVAPRKVDGVWELLHVALAASTGDDANSLVVPVYYNDEPTELSYVGLDQGSRGHEASIRAIGACLRAGELSGDSFSDGRN